MANLIERHRDQIVGVLSCYDRVIIRGTLPSVCHAQAMATTLDARGIRLFDYPKLFAEPLRDAIKAHATRVAAEAGVELEYIKKPTNYRAEENYNVFRWYRGGWGRYTQADPISFLFDDPKPLRGGPHLYMYALNAPTRYTDPTGLCVCVFKGNVGEADC